MTPREKLAEEYANKHYDEIFWETSEEAAANIACLHNAFLAGYNAGFYNAFGTPVETNQWGHLGDCQPGCTCVCSTGFRPEGM